MLLHNISCVLLSAGTLLGMLYAILLRAPHPYSRQQDPLLTGVFKVCLGPKSPPPNLSTEMEGVTEPEA